MRLPIRCCVFLLFVGACASPSSETSTSSSNPPATITTLATTTTTTTTTSTTSMPTSSTTTVPPPAPATTVAPAPSEPEDFFSLSGEIPTAFPDDWSIGFISLLSSLADVSAVLGPPDRSEAGLGEGLFWWALPGGAELEIVTLDGGGILFVGLTIPDGSPVRFGLRGGVVVGASTTGDLMEAWGQPQLCNALGETGCQFLYKRCVGEGDVVATPLVWIGSDESLADDPSVRLGRIVLAEDQYPGSWDVCRSLELESHGLGVADLGTPEEEAAAALLATLGPTRSDWIETWDQPIGIYNGYPVNLRFRQIEWDDLGFRAVFSDGVTWPDGRTGSSFIGWNYWGGAGHELVLTTAGGTTLGSLAQAVFDEFGDDLPIGEPGEYSGWGTALPSAFPDATPFVAGLHFGFSGDPSEASTIVTDISAGVGQSP